MSAIGQDESVPLEINTSVRLSAELAAWLDERAARESRNRSQMIRVLLEQAKAAEGGDREVLEELLEQWQANHFEYCQREWPHPPTRAIPCHWPMPDVLADYVKKRGER